MGGETHFNDDLSFSLIDELVDHSEANGTSHAERSYCSVTAGTGWDQLTCSQRPDNQFHREERST